MKTTLVEATSALTRKGNRWKVVLAVPGKGSKATYSADLLREDGPKAWPAGTKAWIGHDLPQNRDPRDQLGRYPEGAYFDEAFDPERYPEGALVAELDVFDQYKTMIEQIGTDAELSIYADGDVDAQGNATAIYPDRANSVDLVAYGGLAGSGLKEKLYETYQISETISGDKEEGNVDKELIEALAGIKTLLESLVADRATDVEAKAKADVAAQVEAELGAKVDEALAGYDEKVKAIEAADLLPSQVESLKAEARKGNDVVALIESAKKIVDEAKVTLAESAVAQVGVRINGADTKNDDFSVGAWK